MNTSRASSSSSATWCTTAASAAAASELLARLGQRCAVIVLAGNHDRHVERTIELVDRWETPGSSFITGIAPPEVTDRIQIIGHHHPAATIRDGAGLRLKFPALSSKSVAGSCRPFRHGPAVSAGRTTASAASGFALRGECCVYRRFAPRNADRVLGPRLRRQLEVQCGQRVALIGIVIVQAGQSFETAARPARALHSVERPHHEENAKRDDEEINDEGDEVAVVPGDGARPSLRRPESRNCRDLSDRLEDDKFVREIEAAGQLARWAA